MDAMRAARIAGPGRIECERMPVRPPGPGEVLLRTRMASICGSDLHIVFSDVFQPEAPPPGFPGHEGVAEVLESKDPSLAVGDLVLTAPSPPEGCCFADCMTLRAEYCIKLPAYDGPIGHLLMAQQFGTVLFALRQRPLDYVGKTVAVMGQGSAGMFFAYLLKRGGARKVIVSDLSEARLAAAPRFGADVAVMAERLQEAVMDETGGEGADFLVEAVGSAATLRQTTDLLRPGGEMLLFGLPDTKEAVPWNFHDFFRKKLLAHSTHGAQHEVDRVSFKAALDLIAQGDLDVAPLLSHVLPIEQVNEAMHIAHERRDNALKVSLSFD